MAWSAQAGHFGNTESHRVGGARADQVRFRRALARRAVLYEIFNPAAKGKKPRAEALRAFQNDYQNAIRDAEFHPTANHYRLTWPVATHPLDRVVKEIIRSAADLLTSDALTRVR